MLKNFNKILTLPLIFSMAVLSGCSDPDQERFEAHFKQGKQVVTNIDNNFKLVKSHATNPNQKGKYETLMRMALETVAKENPESKEVKSMQKTFINDTTVNGTVFKGLENRFKEFQSLSGYAILKNKAAKDVKHTAFNSTFFVELPTAKEAITVKVFDEHFIDYINILASVSKNVTPVEVDKVNNKAAIGSQFVGNPNYGAWKTNPSTGHTSWSFLETYAMLSIMDNMFDSNRGYNYGSNYGSRNRYRYDSWSNNRNWSYRNDVYNKKHTSIKTQAKNNRFQSSLTKGKYKGAIKKDSYVSKQNKALNTKSNRFSSNLVRKSTNARVTKAATTKSNLSRGSPSKSSSRYSSSMRSSGGSSKSSRGGK
jgi:hypothetical protein